MSVKEAYHRRKVVDLSQGKRKVKNIGYLIRALKKAGQHKERRKWTNKLRP